MYLFSGICDSLDVFCVLRNTFEDLWIGFIKHSNSNVWYSTKSSDCIEKSFTIPGQLFHERQCAVLNMSEPSYSGNPNLLYADSCNGRELGFVCLKSSGKIPKGKFLFQNTVKKKLYTIQRYINTNSRSLFSMNHRTNFLRSRLIFSFLIVLIQRVSYPLIF